MEKSLSAKELAVLYFKYSTPDTAVKQLGRWIRRNKELKAALDKAGFHDRQHIYSPRQIDLIFQYLGNPCQP